MEENSESHKGKKRSFKRKFLIWLIPFFVVNLQRLIGLTSRRINIGDESIRKIRKEKSLTYFLVGIQMFYILLISIEMRGWQFSFRNLKMEILSIKSFIDLVIIVSEEVLPKAVLRL